MLTIKIKSILCLAALWCCFCNARLHAQEKPLPKRIEITKAHIPEDAFGYVSVRVQQIIKHPMLALVPWEIIAAGGMDNFGIDPTAVERVDVIFGQVDGPQVKWCAVVTLTEDWNSIEATKIDMSKLKDALLESTASLISLSTKQLVVGAGDYLEKVGKPPAAEGELAKQVKRIAQSGLATAIFVPAPVQDQIEKDLESAPPQKKEIVLALLANMQMVAMRLELDPKPSIPVLVESASPESAQKFAAVWNQMLKEIFIDSNLGTQGLGPIDTPIKVASVAYEKRFQQEMTRLLTPTVTGNRLIVRLDSQFLQAVQSSSFMPAINAAIVAGDRMNQRPQ